MVGTDDTFRGDANGGFLEIAVDNAPDACLAVAHDHIDEALAEMPGTSASAS